MLREAGALEVHVRIASPPVKWPCFYGIDFASPAELIANASNAGATSEEMLDGVRRSIGADTLGYISTEGMIAAHRAAGLPAVLRMLRRRATRSHCPAKPRSARTSSSTCWRTRPAPVTVQSDNDNALGAAPSAPDGPPQPLKVIAGAAELKRIRWRRPLPAVPSCFKRLLHRVPVTGQAAGRRRDDVVDVVLRHDRVVCERLDQRPGQARRYRRHEADPPTRDGRRQERQHHDEAPAQPRLLGVDLHRVAVLEDVGPPTSQVRDFGTATSAASTR